MSEVEQNGKDKVLETSIGENLFPEDYQFNLSDFALFLSVKKNPKAHQNVLSIIMDEDALELVDVKVEQVILNKSGKRAIRLDAWAMDAKNRQFTTEMQNDEKADDVRKLKDSIWKMELQRFS